MIVLYQSLFYIIVFYYFIIVSCFHLSLASWLLFSNKVQYSKRVTLDAPETVRSWRNGKCDQITDFIYMIYSHLIEVSYVSTVFRVTEDKVGQ